MWILICLLLQLAAGEMKIGGRPTGRVIEDDSTFLIAKDGDISPKQNSAANFLTLVLWTYTLSS